MKLGYWAMIGPAGLAFIQNKHILVGQHCFLLEKDRLLQKSGVYDISAHEKFL